MPDYEGSLPAKTVRDNEFKIEIVDGQSGTTATKKLSVAQEGDAISAGVNDFGIAVFGEDNSSNYKLLSLTSTGALNSVVTATDLDIRDLSHTQDSVKVGDGTDFLAIAADGSIAVTDNGGSLTVDATNLDIRDLTHVSDSVKIGDGTDFAAISATGEVSTELTNAQGADGATAPSDTVQVGGKDGSGNLQTFKTDTNGQLYVIVDESAGATNVVNYTTTATVGVGVAQNHDYVITSTKSLREISVLVGARGAVKVRVGNYNGTTFTPKFTWFQKIQGADNVYSLSKYVSLTGDGTNAVRIEITNLDGDSSDVYSTLMGEEI